jgi:hypothetical protein
MDSPVVAARLGPIQAFVRRVFVEAMGPGCAASSPNRFLRVGDADDRHGDLDLTLGERSPDVRIGGAESKELLHDRVEVNLELIGVFATDSGFVGDSKGQ